jgi:hypothetical protein
MQFQDFSLSGETTSGPSRKPLQSKIPGSQNREPGIF